MKIFMKKLFIGFLCFTLCIGGTVLNVSASTTEVSADDFLALTGMPKENIAKLDSNIKEFMVSDMKKSAVGSMTYVPIESMPKMQPMVNQVLTNITFSASAFKSGSTIYIYPTYEFTADKKPAGEDSFSFQLGDAMQPYEYGGQVWYKDYTMSDWAVGGSMTANSQSSNGGEYSGSQLGSPDYSMKFKGCAYCHANVGTGTDKRVIMGYMYNPSQVAYTISFSVGALGISYNSSSTVYTNASTINLSY